MALLTLACIRGIFNMLILSEKYKYFGIILPALAYLPVVFQRYIYPRMKDGKVKTKTQS